MATQAHCAYCFETLAASFENRPALSLAQAEELWALYQADHDDAQPGVEDSEHIEAATAKPAAITRLLRRVSRSGEASGHDRSSATSSRSNLSTTGTSHASSRSRESQAASGAATPASSVSTQADTDSVEEDEEDEFPLFVTWNTISKSGRKSLRGCLGIFEPYELDYGLSRFALRSAFEDHRFSPIPQSLLPSLENEVTLLTNFSTGTSDPRAWVLGQHGLRISFTHRGQRLGATYLPHIASEQGWAQDETLISLMRKAGWSSGSDSSWEKVWREGRGELITYEGKPAELTYSEWKEWRDWVDATKRQGK